MAGRILRALLLLSACGHDGADDREPLPECEPLATWYPDGLPPWSGARAMVVAASDRERVDLLEALECAPDGGATLSIDGWPEGAWLPPVGAQLVATVNVMDTELATPAGERVWALAYVLPDEGLGWLEWVETDGPACQDLCTQRRQAGARVQTDDGELRLVEGEPRAARIDGESFVALLEAGAEYGTFGPEEPCGVIFDGEYYSFAAVELFRTNAVETPMAEPGMPPLDDCPVELVDGGEPCTTRPDLVCRYTFGDGCVRTLECKDCLWQTGYQHEPLGVDCGVDPQGCQSDGCPEPQVCTHCPCDADDSRWRCVTPGEECAAC